MTERKPPRGWDAERIKRLAAHYDSLSEDEQMAEDEAAMAEQEGQVLIMVPQELLPAIRQMITARTKSH